MYKLRLKILFGVILFGLCLLGFRLFYLQLLKASYYKKLADEIIVREETLETVRGDIVDRNGVLLATTKNSYDICIVPLQFMADENNPEWETDFRRRIKKQSRNPDAWFERLFDDIMNNEDWFLDMSFKFRTPAAELKKRIEKIKNNILKQAKGSRRYERHLIFRREISRPQTLIRGVGREWAYCVESRPFDFPAVRVRPRSERRYPFGSSASNIIGYVAPIDGTEWRKYRKEYMGNKRKRFFLTDKTGRTGIEKYYNYYLRGERGRRARVIDAKKHTQKIVGNDPPLPGENIRLSIDIRIQRLAERHLDNARSYGGSGKGAAVVLDCRTGEVLALATSPRYDSEKIFARYKEYLNDPGRPLVDRAIKGLYPPGSVFKVVVAAAGLELGILSPSKTYTCSGRLSVGDVVFHCYHGQAHGKINLIDAIAHSCNVYFYQAGAEIGPHRIAEYARKFGFGAPSEVDLPWEYRGRLPFYTYTVGPRWTLGRTYNLSIGQGRLAVTPLQIARMMMAIANGGKLFTPHLLLNDEKNQLPKELRFKESTLAVLRQALRQVVVEGTGRKTIESPLVEICGKTGTAQRGGLRKDHGWFAGYAPARDPKIAFAVCIEEIKKGAGGSGTAGPVARNIVEDIFRNELAK